MAISFALTEEQQQLRQLAHEFSEAEIRPVSAHHDETGEYPWPAIKKAHELGLVNTHVPAEYGGLALSALDGLLIAGKGKVDLDEIIDHLLYLSASEGIRQPHTSGADSECDGFRLLMVHDVHVAVGALAEHTPPGT